MVESTLENIVFKEGETVTYKYKKDCGGVYRYSGDCQGGNTGTIKTIERNPEGRVSLIVTLPEGGSYLMAQHEFVEYDERMKELQVPKKVLEPGEKVYFEINGRTLEYTVQIGGRFLYNKGVNSAIFDLLGLNKQVFATKHYGYPAKSGGWPECRPYDFEALTRLVDALQEEIKRQEQSKKPEPVEKVETSEKDYSKFKLSTGGYGFTIAGKSRSWSFELEDQFIKHTYIVLVDDHKEAAFQACVEDFGVNEDYKVVLLRLFKGVIGGGICPEFEKEYELENLSSLYEFLNEARDKLSSEVIPYDGYKSHADTLFPYLNPPKLSFKTYSEDTAGDGISGEEIFYKLAKESNSVITVDGTSLAIPKLKVRKYI